MLAKKFPGVPFDEEAFEKGYATLDNNKDGLINHEDIKNIVEAKVKKEGLYFDH